jgi:hypothetical protein
MGSGSGGFNMGSSGLKLKVPPIFPG